jgi:hypothetical protein
MEEQFLCLLLCATVDRVKIYHSISLIYITHVAIIIRYNLGLYGLPIAASVV